MIFSAALLAVAAAGSAGPPRYPDGRPAATLRMEAKDSHMKRHVGLAWLELPLSVPTMNHPLPAEPLGREEDLSR